MSRFSVKKPWTVFVCVVIILVLGVEAFLNLSTDLLPDMDLPYAIVITTYAGANPETVEQVVTEPIESSMSTISHIDTVSSISSNNYSMVICEFNQNADMDSVTVDMRESLDMLGSYWPDEVGNPIIMKLNPDMMPVMMMAVDKDDASLEDISDFVNDTLDDELKSIDGVASVTASGLLDTSVQVILSQDKIDALNDKLMKKLEAQFDDARDELEDSASELEEGKAELDSQSASFTESMLNAASEITDGKIEIAQKEQQIEDALEEIENAESQLDEQAAELASQKKQLEDNEDTLLALEQQLQNVQDQKASLQEQLSEITAQIKELTEEDAEGNAQQISVLQSQADEMTEMIAVLDSAISEIESQGISVGSTETALSQIAAGEQVISDSRAQLIATKAQLQAGQAQLAAAKAQISTQQSTLNSAQAEAEGQMDDARIQIVTGQQQLESAESALDDSEESAKDAADLTNIITADMVSGILTAQNFSMPAGYVTEDGVDYLVRVGDVLESQEELENLIIFDLSDYDLGKIRLSDVAEVVKTDNSGDNYAKINGNDGIILSLEKQDGYSTADVASDIRDYMAEAEEKYEGLHMTALMDQGIYIDYIVQSVLQNLVLGAILAIIILFIFLKDLRPTFTVALSIPISVVFALVLMYFSGITMNIISLSGLALGVGMLVDNAIVTIENIYRLRALGMAPKEAAIQGAKQVSGAIIASTLTTICIWAPIIFAEGITRMLFVDLVLTIAYSLIASLIVALTVVPAASSVMLKKTKEISHPVFDRVTNAYAGALEKALKKKWLVLAAALALLIVSAGALISKGYEFMGDMDSSQITVSVSMPEDSLFDDTAAMSDEIIEDITSIDDVETVGAIMGSSLSMMSSYSDTDTSSVSMYVILKDDRTHSSSEIAKMIEDKTKDLDCEISVSSSSMDMSSLGGSGVSVNIKGQDLDTLQTVAKDFAEIMRGVEGTVDVSDGIENATPEIRVTVNKNKAMMKGLTVAQVYSEIYNYVAESSSQTTLTVDNKDYPVIVVDDTKEDVTPDDIRSYVFTVTQTDGTEKKVKLKDIAEISESTSLSSISREDQSRYLTVSCEVDEDHNATLVSDAFEEAISDYEMPEGFSYEISGEKETIMEAMYQLLELLAVGILIMYLIMVAQFQSLISPFIVLFTLPLAFTGGFLGLILTGNIISIIAMVGFVMLCGIIVNNGIVFIDYVNQLRETGLNKHDALIETGKTRLRPILMTALTTIFAMSTMALGLGEGTDMVQPMAIVTIGGLIYGTFMTLFVVPCIYDIVRRERRKAGSEENQDEI